MASTEVLAASEVEEYEDEDELIDAAADDADEVDEQYRHWFPPEYMVGILGHRGGGKSAILAFYLFNCLAHGDTVFTNLELWPEKWGITNKPNKLELDNLLNFDPGLRRAVLGIEEVGMWLERKRAMSTTSILTDKFMQLVIRKQGLRIFFTNQSPLLPIGLAEQTDVVQTAYDVFFCEWAREAGLAKGTTFLYDTVDRTGIFGRQGRQWRISVRRANRLWNTFNSYQMYDPYQWARKTIIKGQEQVIDMDGGETYAMSEEGLRVWQTDVKAFSVVLNKLISSYRGNGFMGLAEKYNAVEEHEDRYRFSVDGIRKALVNTRGQARHDAEQSYSELLALAQQGDIVRFGPGHSTIEMAKPVQTQEEAIA